MIKDVDVDKPRTVILFYPIVCSAVLILTEAEKAIISMFVLNNGNRTICSQSAKLLLVNFQLANLPKCLIENVEYIMTKCDFGKIPLFFLYTQYSVG